MSRYIEIEKEELVRLRQSEAFLEALEKAGVDNWEGYSIAWRAVHEEEDEE